MHNVAFFFFALAVSAVIIFPIRFLQARGGTGAKLEYDRAFREIGETGRTVVRGSGRVIVELDFEGFRYGMAHVSWLDIVKPLAIEKVSKHSYPVVFYYNEKNLNFGKRRMFADTASEFIEKQGVLPEYYKMGTDRVLFLMNKLRDRAHERTSQGVGLWPEPPAV